MRSLLLGLLLLLVGCSATPLVYSPQDVASRGDAVFFIKQVMFEQSYWRRPEDVVVTSTFIAYTEGEINTNDIDGYVLSTNAVINRVYFNRIGDIKLLQKRSRFIVQLFDNNDNFIDEYYTEDRHKAEEFMDAIHYFVAQTND